MQFSPTGRSWAAATTEGLLIYSLDETFVFDPFELDIDITPSNIQKTLHQNEFLKAIIVTTDTPFQLHVHFILDVYSAQRISNSVRGHRIDSIFRYSVNPPKFPSQLLKKARKFFHSVIHSRNGLFLDQKKGCWNSCQNGWKTQHMWNSSCFGLSTVLIFTANFSKKMLPLLCPFFANSKKF